MVEGPLMLRRMSSSDHREEEAFRYSSKNMSVSMAVIACIGILPSVLDEDSHIFVLPILLNPSLPLALSASHALQLLCVRQFISVNQSILKYLETIAVNEPVSITILIRQLSGNLDYYTSRAVELSLEITACCLSLVQSLDALALTYLAHVSSAVRSAAFLLTQCVLQFHKRMGNGHSWCLASCLIDRGAGLVSSAHILVQEFRKAQYPDRSPIIIANHHTSEGAESSSVLSISSADLNISFGDVVRDSLTGMELMSSCLIVLVRLLGDTDRADVLLDLCRSMITWRLSTVILSGQCPDTIQLWLTTYLTIKPRSDLAANDLFLQLWQYVLSCNHYENRQKLIEMSLFFAHVDHLSLLLATLSQARNTAVAASTLTMRISSTKRSRKGLVLTDRACIDAVWSSVLVAISEPKRLRVAFMTSPRARSVYLELCRFGVTKSFLKWCKAPDHLGNRAQFLSNVCFALRRRHKYEGVDFSGPFLEAEIPEWTQDDRSRTLRELRAWSECGLVATPEAEEVSLLLRTEWNRCMESQVQSSLTPSGKHTSDKQKAALSIDLQTKMKVEFPEAVSSLRLRAFWSASRILSLGPVLDDTAIAEGGWLDWALLAETNGVPVLQMLVCFHWREMPKLIDRLYWETSEDGPLAQHLFIACASQLVPVPFGLSPIMTRHELEDSVPLSHDDIALKNLKRPLIHDMLTPLLVVGISNMGSPFGPVAQTAGAMLARLCDTVVTRHLTKDQAKSLSILRTHHPGLWSEIITIRLKNALIISRTVANLCDANLINSIINEIVLRWAQVLQIFLQGLDSDDTEPLTDDRFRALTLILFQSSILLSWSSCSRMALRVLKATLRKESFIQTMRQLKDGDDEGDPLSSGFMELGWALKPFGYMGVQSAVIDVFMDLGCCDVIALTLLPVFWSIPSHSIMDMGSGSSRLTLAVISILPWLWSIRDHPIMPAQVCAHLSSAMDASLWSHDFQTVIKTLRALGEETADPNRMEALCMALCRLDYSGDAEAWSLLLLRMMRRAHPSLHTPCLNIASILLRHLPRPSAFAVLITYISDSIVSIRDGPELDQAADLIRIYSSSSECLRSSSDIPEDVAPSVSEALTCLCSHGFFVESLTTVSSPSFMTKNRVSTSQSFVVNPESGSIPAAPISNRGEGASKQSSTGPVPCTLANLIEYPHLEECFRKFVAQHYDIRALDFYSSVMKDFRSASFTDPKGDLYKNAAQRIIDRFIRPGAKELIDVDASIRDEIMGQMSRSPGPGLFIRSTKAVKPELMTAYSAFCDSPQYDRLVRSGQLALP